MDTGVFRVLHVDDDDALLSLSEAMLERESDHLNVLTETSAEVALERLQDERIDAVISDYDMPQMNGLEFLQEFRTRYPDTPFILYTGKGSEEIASRAISEGVTDYLQKGTGTDQYTVLANRVLNSISKHRAEQEAARGFRAIETADEAIGLLTPEGEYMYVNEAYSALCGKEPDEMVGEHWKSIYSDEALIERLEGVLNDLEPDGELWREVHEMEPQPGERVTVRHSLSYAADDTLICTLLDVTEHYETLEELKHEREFITAALNSIDDLFFVIDADGTLSRVNDTIVETLGYSREELHGTSPERFFIEADRTAVIESVAESFESGSAEAVARLVDKDGEQIPVHFRAVVIPSSDGSSYRLCGIGRDIADQWETMELLERQENQFTQLTSFMRHDLKNPLAVISGRGELAMETATGETQDQLEHVLSATERLEELIDGFAETFCRESLIAEFEPVALGEVTRDVWNSQDTGDISLNTIDEAVYADRKALSRILQNVFSNSLDHGEGVTTVEVGLLSENDGFYVQDDGASVDIDTPDSLFNLGYSTEPDNTGFGLALVKQLSEALGWDPYVSTGTAGGFRVEFHDVTFELAPENAPVT